MPIPTSRFLPDFIADEQMAEFVLDHNGAHLEHLASERERELIGQHWATRNGGRCLFAMVPQCCGGASLRRKSEAALA